MTSLDPTAASTPEGAEILAADRRRALQGEPPLSAGPAEDSRMVRSVKDACIAATIAGLLTLFFFFMRSDIAVGGLVLSIRPDLWLIAIGLVFAVRFLLSY